MKHVRYGTTIEIIVEIHAIEVAKKQFHEHKRRITNGELVKPIWFLPLAPSVG